MSDIEIARHANLHHISDIALNLGIPEVSIIPYGQTKAKINLDYIKTLKDKQDSKLILVTAITPTPAG